jgi:hypothetical protein
MAMETSRRIAGAPVRSATETCDRLLEFAGTWGGTEKVGDLSAAKPVLRALILDRILQRHPLVVEYGPHTLQLYCDYEDEALDISGEAEDLLSRLPYPVGDDVAWRIVVPCPDGLLSWAVDQTQAIRTWFIVAGSDGKVHPKEHASAEIGTKKGRTVEIDLAALQRLIDRRDRTLR